MAKLLAMAYRTMAVNHCERSEKPSACFCKDNLTVRLAPSDGMDPHMSGCPLLHALYDSRLALMSGAHPLQERLHLHLFDGRR